MYCYDLKFTIWWGNKSVVRNRFLATEDVEHESNAFEAKHIISSKLLASVKAPSWRWSSYLLAGISILSCAASCLPLTMGRSEVEVLKYQLAAVCGQVCGSHILIKLQPYSTSALAPTGKVD